MKNEIDFGELKTIYDADSLGQDYEGVKDLSTATQKCPEFLFHEITTSVKFLDKSHNMVNISVSEFNEFVDMARNCSLKISFFAPFHMVPDCSIKILNINRLF